MDDFFSASALLLYADILGQHGLSSVPVGPSDRQSALTESASAASSLEAFSTLPVPKPVPGEPALAAAARELAAALGELNALANTLYLTRGPAGPAQGAPPPLFERVPIAGKLPPAPEWYARQRAIARGHKLLALSETSSFLAAAAGRVRSSLPGQSLFLNDLRSLAQDGWAIVTAGTAQTIAEAAHAAAHPDTASAIGHALAGAGPGSSTSPLAPRLPPLPHVVCVLPAWCGHNASSASNTQASVLVHKLGARLLAPLQVRDSAGVTAGEDERLVHDDGLETGADVEMGGATSTGKAMPAARRRRHVVVLPPQGFAPSSLRVHLTCVPEPSEDGSSGGTAASRPVTATAVVDIAAAATSSCTPAQAASVLRDPVPWAVAASAAASHAFDLLTAAAVAHEAAARRPPVTHTAPTGPRFTPDGTSVDFTAATSAGGGGGDDVDMGRGLPGEVAVGRTVRLPAVPPSSAPTGAHPTEGGDLFYPAPSLYRGFQAEQESRGRYPRLQALSPTALTWKLSPTVTLTVELAQEAPPWPPGAGSNGATASALAVEASRIARVLSVAALTAASAASKAAADALGDAAGHVSEWQRVLAGEVLLPTQRPYAT